MRCEKGSLAIIDESRWQLGETPEAFTPFVEMLSALSNHFERAIVTFLDHQDFWKGATHADTLSNWRKRKNMLHQLANFSCATTSRRTQTQRPSFRHGFRVCDIGAGALASSAFRIV